MNFQQGTVLAILAVSFGLFVWGRWRFDLVAFAALLAGVIVGVVPAAEAFHGFGHPATITVAMVLILTRALTNSGVSDIVARAISVLSDRPNLYMATVCVGAAALSGVVNNVGALALMMPVALQAAERTGRAPGTVLMPLAFASILGGLVTLVGTPPNIVIATFRGEVAGESFGLFDFTPVGLAVAVAGTAFLVLAGWRFLPVRAPGEEAAADVFNIAKYITEARVLKNSAAWGKTMGELDEYARENDVLVVCLIRRNRRQTICSQSEPLKTNDILVLEGGPERIGALVTQLGLRIVGSKDHHKSGILGGHDAEVVEAVVAHHSRLLGRTPESLRLPSRFGVSLMAVARRGRPYRGRLKQLRFRIGDVILLFGEPAALTAAIFGLSVLVAAVGLLPFTVTLSIAALAVVASNIVPVREIMESVDWSVVVLLGSLIPLGHALESTGTTALIAEVLFQAGPGADPMVEMSILLLLSVIMTAVLNNAATAVILAPLAIDIAAGLGVNADPFLMVGASAAFLTPVAHQNNILVMGPGDYVFADYLRMGGPLTVIVCAVAIPLIPVVWPF